MRVAHHLTTTDGIIGVTTSCWVENLHLSFGVSTKNARVTLNGAYRVTS